MERRPNPARLGGWGYALALYCYGMYLVYPRTGEESYLTYIQGWIDEHVDESGTIDRKITALDYMLPGNVLLLLYKETGQQKYKTAASTIRTTFDSYPRTENGGFWHAQSRQHQLWLDGVYMSLPFLVRYGAMFDDSQYALVKAAKQLMIYARHLNDPATGLMFHASDESGQQAWADPVAHHSPIFWCRSIGWFGMTLVDMLEIIAKGHARRENLNGRFGSWPPRTRSIRIAPPACGTRWSTRAATPRTGRRHLAPACTPTCSLAGYSEGTFRRIITELPRRAMSNPPTLLAHPERS